jgi:hypothetical protein
MCNRSWKYWHSPMLHAKAMAIVVAYDIYKELVEGNVDEDWKLDKPVDFFIFRETLARQMLSYSPVANKYLGDSKFRAVTQSSKSKRSISPPPPPRDDDGNIITTAAGICMPALESNVAKKRLCGFIANLTDHFDACQTMEEKGKKLNCAFCGKPTYQFCALCGVAMHKFPPQDNPGATPCFYLYHDTGCFGLARNDWKITQKKMKDWAFPTPAEINLNQQQMKSLQEQVDNGVGAKVTSNNSDSDSDDSD